MAFGKTKNYGLLFISNDVDKSCPYIFSTTLADHTENTMFIKSAKKLACWKYFIQMFELR